MVLTPLCLVVYTKDIKQADKGETMNTKANDRLHRQIMKSMEVRVELLNTATSEAERAEHISAIEELSISARVLTSRI